MNLDRTFKASHYLLAFSGAMAFSMAGGSWAWPVLVAICACVAAATVDAGRIGALRPSVQGGILLAALPILLYRWHARTAGDGAALAEELGGLLCLSQAVSFFGVRRGSAVPIWANMALLLLSARMDGGPDLILRIVLLTAAAAWFLLLSSVSAAKLAWERSGEISLSLKAGAGGGGRLDRRCARQWVPLWGTAVLADLLLGAVFFLAAPRALGDMSWVEMLRPVETRTVSEGRRPRSGAAPGWAFDTGLGERAPLRGIARLKYDSRKTLSLKLSGQAADKVSIRNLYLRGLCFSDYVNGAWESPAPGRVAVSDADDGKADGWTAVLSGAAAPAWSEDSTVLQDIEILLQGGIGYFLCMAPAVAIRWPSVLRDRDGTLWTGDGGTISMGERYSVRSLLPPNFLGDAVPTGDLSSPAGVERERCLEASALTPAAQTVAARAAMDSGARSDADKAEALLRLFRDSGRWRYSLDLEWTSSVAGDLVSAFIADERCRSGHCMLFASAFVLSCRALGVPARLATGLAGGEYDASRDEYVFRNRDAHAWAEVFLAGTGWVRFDPTPDIGRIGPPVVPPVRMFAGENLPPAMPGERPIVARGWVDRSWDFVLSYDATAQSALIEAAAGKLRSALGIGSDRGRETYVGRWIPAAAAALAAAVCLLLATYRFAGRGRDRRGSVSKMHPRQKAALRFYNELLAMLAGRGIARGPSQTPSEFAATVARRTAAIAAPVAEVTRIFERTRYGGIVPGPEDELKLKEAMEEIGRAFRGAGEPSQRA